MIVSIHPNPINSTGHLVFESSENHQVQIRVTDLKGKVVSRKKASVQKGQSTVTLYSYTWKAGLYFIECSNDKGDQKTLKVLKIK